MYPEKSESDRRLDEMLGPRRDPSEIRLSIVKPESFVMFEKALALNELAQVPHPPVRCEYRPGRVPRIVIHDASNPDRVKLVRTLAEECGLKLDYSEGDIVVFRER